jgi:methionyl aminopeptidase
LVEVTKQSFFEGIKFAKVGYRIGDISSAIGKYVEKNGFSVIKEFQGHGIGRDMHEDPGVPNYGEPGKGIRLEPGMTLAIEPMVSMGKEYIEVLEDGWTIVTQDQSLAAHYENTILITEKEPEILTII